MKKAKNILIAIGILAIVVFLALLVMGVKIAGSIFMYILGFLGIIFIIGFVIYLFNRAKKGLSRNERSDR